jgi:hypothetical protein
MLRDQLMQAKGQFDAILRTDLQALNRRLQEQNRRRSSCSDQVPQAQGQSGLSVVYNAEAVTA